MIEGETCLSMQVLILIKKHNLQSILLCHQFVEITSESGPEEDIPGEQ